MVSMVNILDLFENLARFRTANFSTYAPSGKNRINSAGSGLEFFIKDAFCGCIGKTAEERKKSYAKTFSYCGSHNSPPDIMILGGDAVEIKKFESIGRSDIPLNSSYPKDKLYSDSPLLTEECRANEKWDKKDFVYSLGFLQEGVPNLLIFVYGDCYAADRKVYERIKSDISRTISGSEYELSETNELGRVNAVDPMGITYLRVRGMWGIKSPLNVFPGMFEHGTSKSLAVFALMRKSKFDSFSEGQKTRLRGIAGFSSKDVRITDPNNTAKSIDAVLLKLVAK